MEFVRIEPGTFLMGTSEKWKEKWDKFNSAYVTSNIRIPYTNEFPQHKVTITKGFYLGKYEVSIGQWIALMDLPEVLEEEWLDTATSKGRIEEEWSIPHRPCLTGCQGRVRRSSGGACGRTGGTVGPCQSLGGPCFSAGP